ncbi:MAG: hypothetical protein IRY99_15880 [Isosphaeraceae bacterium]|nr:hypothetical protein [Isosphaeraceae bacterium]
MIRRARPAEPWARTYAILGLPGLMIALFSSLAFAFGLVVLVREYDRLRTAGRVALRPVLANWVRTEPVHYLRRTLPDYADAWRRAPEAERSQRLAALRWVLNYLGDELAKTGQRTPLIEILAMDLAPRGGEVVASWRPHPGRREPSDLTLTDRFELVPPGSGSRPAVDLTVRYRVAPAIERTALDLETSYRRLLLALLGMSGYSLLCLGYMVLHARALRDRAARESAQAATLDLADRTCHELGNVAFVLANEGRNLADHLDLVERFVAEEPDALAAAAHRAGLDPEQARRFLEALDREHAERGLAPEVELRGGAAIARDVCRQVAVCSEYIALTVRELDAYLKQSSLPVAPRPVPLDPCLDDALALLGPSLEAASVRVERRDGARALPLALADRRLVVHALVNLLKNAIEATKGAGIEPRIALAAGAGEGMVWIEVTDNGPGIPAEALPRIFEHGYSTKGAGRGRGPAPPPHTKKAQGGRLRGDSALGRGTTFRLELPAAPAQAVEEPGASHAASVPEQ